MPESCWVCFFSRVSSRRRSTKAETRRRAPPRPEALDSRIPALDKLRVAQDVLDEVDKAEKRGELPDVSARSWTGLRTMTTGR